MRYALVAVLLIAFSGAPSLHAFIPHSHGDDHHHTQSGESAIWTSLHGAVRHEDKKILAHVDVDTVTLALIALASLAGAFAGHSLSVRTEWHPLRGRYLTRGLAPYRRFV